jgi:hypothetical protein
MPSAASPAPLKPAGVRLRCLALLALLAAILAGCGAVGEPVARHPITPQRVTDLTARQQGDAVVLSFALPRDSTDKDPLAAVPSVEIYRSGPLTPGAAPPKPPPPSLVDTIPSDVVKNYVRDNRFEFSDPLDSAEIAQTPGAQRRYIVRTRVSAKRASDDSNSVLVPVYPAPDAIHDLRATLTEPAIILAWTPPERTVDGALLPTAPAYRVYRAEIMSAAGAAANPPAAQTQAPLQLLGPAAAAEYRDSTFEFGHNYVYSVRSTTPAGTGSVEAADSNVVGVAAKDVFPPATPQAVVAVLVPAAAGQPAYVDLTWAISPESDLAGYAVYRSEQAGAPGERLTPALLPVPAFRDMSVAPGRRYFYRVTALDTAGNESTPSEAAAVDIQ